MKTETVEKPMRMSEIRVHLGLGETTFSALKNVLGLKEARIGFVSQFSDYLREHPNFKQRDVYHRPRCTCADCKKKLNSAPTGKGRRRTLAANN